MDQSSQLATQAVLAALFTYGLQGAKSVPWISWIGDHAPVMSRILSAVFAALVAAGFSWHLTGSPETGWTGTVSIPPLPELMAFAQTALLQYLGQDVLYHTRFGIKGKLGLQEAAGAPAAAQPEAS